MAAQRVNEGAIAYEPVLVDVTAKMHELVDEIHAGRHAHEQPANIGREQKAENDGKRKRHQNEYDEGIRRKYGHTPILVIAESHLLVGKELMMIERMTLVDGAQAFDVDRPVHDI